MSNEAQAKKSPFLFYSRAGLVELLIKAGLNHMIQADERIPLLVETTYLKHWNKQLGYRPRWHGLAEHRAFVNDDGMLTMVFRYEDYKGEDAPEEIVMIFDPNPTDPDNYGLQIIRNENLVYWRDAGQKPATEWMINEMANDPEITNEYGRPLFVGETHNV